MKIFTLIIFMGLLLVSCSEKSEVDPIFKKDAPKIQAFQYRFSTSGGEVESPTNGFSEVAGIGEDLKDFVDILADLVLEEQGGELAEVSPEVINLDGASRLPWDRIQNFKVKLLRVHVKTRDGSKLDLGFVKEVEIGVTDGDRTQMRPRLEGEGWEPLPEPVKVGEIPEDVQIAFRYQAEKSPSSCGEQCLELEIDPKFEWKKLLQNSRDQILTVFPRLTVIGIPKSDFTIEFEIEFEVLARLL